MWNKAREIKLMMPYLIFIILVVLLIFIQIRGVYYLYNTTCCKGFKYAYVSDEIYYVSSARNYLVKIFNIDDIKTNDSSYVYYTLFFEVVPDSNIIYKLSVEYNIDVIDMDYSRSFVVTIVVPGEESNSTFYKYFGGANAIYVRSCCRENVIKLIDAFSLYNYTVIDAIPGWAYPDKLGINNYLNPEHPPLGKYFIALSILILGDYPIAWRISSITATIIVFILSYFITIEVLKDYIDYGLSKWISLLVPIILFFDSSLRTIGILAMLDPYVALFTIIGVYFFLREKNLLHDFSKKISWILAGLTKFSGLFIVPAELIEKTIFNTYTLKQRLKILIKEVSIYIPLYIIFLLITSLPLITYMGFNEWFNQSIIGAFKWHTRTKHALTSGPPTTSPIDWLFGWNAFPLWYDPQIGAYVKCMGIPPVYLASFILNLLFAPITLKLEKPRRLWLSFYSIWFMYMVLYIIGNRSLYSFYIIQFSPLLVIQFVLCISILFKIITVNL
ncbi:MAG: hypothetical protein DRO40_09650 [Thermoprotei archaeon]|nr:MAG: hypothetical protein DRO40_09650 [Thermoprotei archaeon]